MALPRPPSGAALRPRVAKPGITTLARLVIALAGPAYARFGLKLRGVEFRHAERLLRELAAFESGKSRLLIAFRHPYGDEPQLLGLALRGDLPREARRLGLKKPRTRHLLFVHGYEVPLWTSAFNRWLLPRSGAMPVYHTRLDSESIGTIRRALAAGAYPLALAPEGQASYHSENLPRMESGAMRFARWCAADLKRAGKDARVSVLPISVHYKFQTNEAGLRAFMKRIERFAGMEPATIATDFTARNISARLDAIYARLLGIAERYFRNGFMPDPKPDDGRTLAERRETVIETALRRGEAAFGLPHSGDPIQRVYRIRQEGWDRVFPANGLPKRGSLGRALADRRAVEAWYAMRHMELVDLLWYVDHSYWKEGASIDKLVESAYNMCDFASRLIGGNITNRPNAFRKRAVLIIGEPIPGGAEAAEERLKRAFMDCVEEYKHEGR